MLCACEIVFSRESIEEDPKKDKTKGRKKNLRPIGSGLDKEKKMKEN